MSHKLFQLGLTKTLAGVAFLAVAVGLAASGTTPVGDAAAKSTTLVAPNQPGSLVGKVLMADGTPAEKVPVKLMTHELSRAGGGARPADGLVAVQDDDQGMKVVARAVTDAEGKFKMPRVEPGKYTLDAGNLQTVGRKMMGVTVTAGKETDLGQLTLSQSLGGGDSGKKNRGGDDGRRR